MDPFTQRMLERAKIRREKLDSQIGQKQELGDKTVLNENTCINENGRDFKKLSENKNRDKKEMQCISGLRKSKLQKLAQFYSGNDENIPLDNESIDGDPIGFKSAEKHNSYKITRLDELATKIRQWESETDHSVHFATKSNTSVHVTDDEVEQKREKTKKQKQSLLDTSMVEKLGFSLSESQSKLTYDFGNRQEKTRNASNTEKKLTLKGQESIVSESKIFFGGKKGLEKNDSRVTAGSQNLVLKKAAFFESNVKEEQNKTIKDPAELSLAERKAIFERKKCAASAPKSRFATKQVSLEGSSVEGKSLKNISGFKESIFDGTKENKSNEILEQISEEVKNRKEDTEDNTKSSDKHIHLEEPCYVEFNQNRDISISTRTDSSDDKDDKTSCNTEPPPLPKSTVHTLQQLEHYEKAKSEDLGLKSGRLYPSLSNLDVSEDIETIPSEMDSSNESKKSNIYLNMTLTDLLDINKNNPSTPPSDQSFTNSKECQVLNKLDKLFDYASNDFSSENDDDCENIPSPPKMMRSSSFEYKSSHDEPESLLHTVSFYRKLQQNSCEQVNDAIMKEENQNDVEDESILVQNKIQSLITEVNKQQTIISQASQALNLCLSTVEFLGSGEQVEGERLLLLASHKRQACLNEIQRLKIENSLQPLGENNSCLQAGDICLSNISVMLKRSPPKAFMTEESLQYFVCLIKSDERVLATPALSSTKENLKGLALQFPGQIKLEGLLSNFKVTVEVYNLELGKELLPHDVKYHINNKKEKKLLTPLKNKRSESKLVKPHVQSPAGPNAVRTSLFQMCGFIVFSLKEVTRTQWTLNKVPFISPLEGTISMQIQSQLRLNDEFRGFLTMFDDISGLGAWHRRWCLLSSHLISYWKYPDDEHKKVPLGTIDLKSVITENVGLVSRDICARLHTFLLETTRSRLSGDRDSLVLNVQDNCTTIRHLLSADSKQEMMTWCKKLNTILDLLRSWKCN